eukprot:5692410-Prymnesium_polylepis.3
MVVGASRCEPASSCVVRDLQLRRLRGGPERAEALPARVRRPFRRATAESCTYLASALAGWYRQLVIVGVVDGGSLRCRAQRLQPRIGAKYQAQLPAYSGSWCTDCAADERPAPGLLRLSPQEETASLEAAKAAAVAGAQREGGQSGTTDPTNRPVSR